MLGLASVVAVASVSGSARDKPHPLRGGQGICRPPEGVHPGFCEAAIPVNGFVRFLL